MIDFRTSHWRTGLVCLGLVLGTLAIYWPARHYGFVDYDDNEYIINNPTVRAGLSWGGLAWSFVDQHASNWHPLTWLSHMLDCQLFGLNAGPAHMVNVLFHCANAVLLFLLLHSMTGAFWRSALVAALFAWHPLHVESVAWISERKDVLSGFFFMLTLWMYGLHIKREVVPLPEDAEEHVRSGFSPAPRRSVFYKLSLGFFVLGLLSKPMLVTVPLVLLLIDFWPLRRFAAGNGVQSASKMAKELLAEKWPFFVLSTAIGVVTFFAQREGGATASGPPTGFFSRMGEAAVGYLGYLEKLVWPRHLACLYLRPDQVDPGTALVALLVLACIFMLATAHLRRRPHLMMGWLWFLVMLLPVSGLVQFGLQSIADRYTYLPSIGFFIMCVWAAAEAAETACRPAARKLAPGIAATAVWVGCAMLSRHQLTFWQNTETLMEHALKIDPGNYVAHNELGLYFSENGQTRDALRQYQLERELDPHLAPSPDSATRSNSLEAPALLK